MADSAVTQVELEFADGEYVFALKLPQLAELQRVCNAGIFTIYGRVLRGRYVLSDEIIGKAWEGEAYSHDIYETIRLALIGGGSGIVGGEELKVDAIRAKRLMETYVHPAPLTEVWAIAAAVLSAKIEGYSPKKAAPAKAPAKPSRKRTTASNSQT